MDAGLQSCSEDHQEATAELVLGPITWSSVGIMPAPTSFRNSRNRPAHWLFTCSRGGLFLQWAEMYRVLRTPGIVPSKVAIALGFHDSAEAVGSLLRSKNTPFYGIKKCWSNLPTLEGWKYLPINCGCLLFQLICRVSSGGNI